MNTAAISTDPVTQALAEAIAERINLDALAARIADHLRTAAPTYDPDEPYPAPLIRQALGRHGRPAASQTLQRYISEGRLRVVPNPADRRTKYIHRGDWERLKKEIGK